MNRNKNARYHETDSRIRNYVLNQLQTKPLKEITVSALCSELKLNRSSFYLHYPDIYAVADAICRDEINGLMESFGEVKAADDQPFDPLTYLLVGLKRMREKRAFFYAYFNELGVEEQRRGTQQFLDTVIVPHFRAQGVSEWAATMRFAFSHAGILAVIRLWLNDGCQQEPEQVIEVLRGCLRYDGS